MPKPCKHLSPRLFTWIAYDGTRVVCCCDCGTVLTGSSTFKAKEKMTMDAKTNLQAVAAHMATECFTAEYVQTMPQENREIEGLGIALAQWAG